MRRRTDISLRTLGPDPDGCLRSAALLDGSDTGLAVTGSELCAAIEHRGLTTLFVLYGDPYEESLEISLADASWTLLDRATLGASGATGRFRDLRLEPPSVLFTFFADRPYRLTLHERPRLAIPWVGLGIGRPLQWRRFFSVGPA